MHLKLPSAKMTAILSLRRCVKKSKWQRFHSLALFLFRFHSANLTWQAFTDHKVGISPPGWLVSFHRQTLSKCYKNIKCYLNVYHVSAGILPIERFKTTSMEKESARVIGKKALLRRENKANKIKVWICFEASRYIEIYISINKIKTTNNTFPLW